MGIILVKSPSPVRCTLRPGSTAKIAEIQIMKGLEI